MEGREGRDPGYDDWFDEPEPPTETQTAAGSSLYDGDDEVWVLPEEEERRDRGRRGGIVVAGRTLTTAQAVVIAVSILAVFFAILAAAGVFNSSPAPVPTVSTQPPPSTATHSTPTTTTAPPAQAPSQTLQPGDTGAQVTTLQVALNSLGYSVGKPDGDYGPATQNAVEQFQAANNLATDGVVGPKTLATLQQALSG
jgi:Putative peptidoglycan binding domain